MKLGYFVLTRRQASLALGASVSRLWGNENTQGDVRLYRIPNGGIQPQATLDAKDTIHLVYYSGDARHGDLFYVRSEDGGATFSAAVPVNKGGSAIAAGTIRGAQIAIGRAGRVHAAWNGSNDDGPLNLDSGTPGAPMLYSRLEDSGNVFEAERNLMRHSFGLNGGGSIAADRNGNVYVAWHGIGQQEAKQPGKAGEGRRRVWIARSEDDGQTFSAEAAAWARETGACGCCGMKIFATRNGNVFALYRSAMESVHRDIYLLFSGDRGRTFEGKLLHKWDINACPMSSMDITEGGDIVAAAWETGGQIYWTTIDGGRTGEPVAAPGEGKGRKHPRLAVNRRGEVLLVWTEGTGWEKGGSFAYQRYDRGGKRIGETKQVAGIPTWSFAAAVGSSDGSFSIVY